MQRKYTYLLILILAVAIGIVHGVAITPSANLFFSWLLVGIWVVFTIHLLHKVNVQRQYNAPHNTSFFIFGPISVGILYSFWGYFTELLEWNLFGLAPLYLSPWTVLFASPYLGYGIYSLYSCFRRYDVVYLGQKSVSARAFGFFITTLMIILGITSLLIYIIITAIGTFPFSIRVPTSPDFFLLLTSILAIGILIGYGIFGRRPSVAEIAARSRQPETVRRPSRPRSTTPRTTRSSTQSTSSTPRTRSRSSTSTQSRPQTSSTSSSTTTRASKPASKPKRKPKEKVDKSKLQKLIKYIKPKAGHLTIEDFKCIFCFELPKYPEDQGRGIVVCPKCKHPAHADEFKEWLRDSHLCSRCDSPLPPHFRQTPQIISVKTYLAVMKKLAKKS